MKKVSAIKQGFFSLSLRAEKISSDVHGELVDDAFDAVLNYVEKNPDSKDDFVDAFLELAQDPSKGPPELIQYCMHALRWEEVKSKLLIQIEQESSERVRYVLRNIIVSFNNDWHDANAYRRFS